jgi:hypothetical protein
MLAKSPSLRVRAKIKFHFQVLRRLPGKAPTRRNIVIFLGVGNAARKDASANKNVKLFLREPLVSWGAANAFTGIRWFDC